MIGSSFGLVIRIGISSHMPGTRPVTSPSIANRAGEPFPTFHLYEAASEVFPAQSTVTTES